MFHPTGGEGMAIRNIATAPCSRVRRLCSKYRTIGSEKPKCLGHREERHIPNYDLERARKRILAAKPAPARADSTDRSPSSAPGPRPVRRIAASLDPMPVAIADLSKLRGRLAVVATWIATRTAALAAFRPSDRRPSPWMNSDRVRARIVDRPYGTQQ